MKTLMITLIIIAIIAVLYNINKYIIKRNSNINRIWGWDDVCINLCISIIFPITVIFWIYAIAINLPKVPETPPSWL